MSDIPSGLPVRTEADGTDERLHVKIVDGTTPSQRAAVDTDQNLHVEVHGNDPSGADRVIRTSELGHVAIDGVHSGTNNTDPSSIGLVGLVRNASPADSQQTLRITAKANAAGDVRAIDVSMHDSSGEAFSNSNPFPVYIASSAGSIVRVHDYNEGANIAAAATSVHTYTVASGETLLIHGVWASASGKMKIELQVGDGAPVEAFTTKAVRFNSTADPQCDIAYLDVPLAVVGTANNTTVKIIRTNRDNQPQSLYTTLVGTK